MLSCTFTQCTSPCKWTMRVEWWKHGEFLYDGSWPFTFECGHHTLLIFKGEDEKRQKFNVKIKKLDSVLIFLTRIISWTQYANSKIT